MDFPQIGILLAAAALYVLFLPARWRPTFLMVGSVVGLFWLQPTLPVRWLDYTLPALTLVIVALCWRLTLAPDARVTRADWLALALTAGIAALLLLPRYIELPPALEITSRPPPAEITIPLVAGLSIAGMLLARLASGTRRGLLAGVFVLAGLFVLLKFSPLTTTLAGLARSTTGQDAALASPVDLGWLGFSYIAFRLIHTLRDRQTGILPALGFRDYLSYVIFTPALVAGPIDRAENHGAAVAGLAEARLRDPARITTALGRIAVGLFKKFVIADTLAIFSLGPLTASQADGAGATWVLLYAYAFRLFFDFSGYTDIAIGIGLLFGVQLPENFDRPYLKQNLTIFWQSWHKSLSDWGRFYIYSPLSRALLKRKPKPGNYVIIFSATAATFIVIGLWHGITLPFLLWGAWHALGLFAHKLWTDRTRAWYRGLSDGRRRAWHVVGTLLTFHFVALGWVWFALPDIGQGLRVFAALFGIGGGA
ncbi:MAG: hypothetical protein KME04_08480 [Pleurocapsa minor GSE-CHR-MK-17-07R]|nr:hypothetical protein [Pleurocapsa minor GSE-CHR-MK 17-07R]